MYDYMYLCWANMSLYIVLVLYDLQQVPCVPALRQKKLKKALWQGGQNRVGRVTTNITLFGGP